MEVLVSCTYGIEQRLELMEKLLEIGSKFGLEGKDLMKFVEEQQAYEREDRRKEREIRKLEVEREIEVKQLEEKRAQRRHEQELSESQKRHVLCVETVLREQKPLSYSLSSTGRTN